MKHLILAAALVAATQPAHATGLAETLVEPEVIAEEVRDASSGGFIIPLLLLALLAAVVSSGGGSDVVDKTGPVL